MFTVDEHANGNKKVSHSCVGLCWFDELNTIMRLIFEWEYVILRCGIITYYFS